MKLVHPDYKYQIELYDGESIEIILENTRIFTYWISELNKQAKGESGKFVLSENGNIYKISEKLCCIVSPFDISLNQKVILNRLYMDIKHEIETTELLLQMSEIHNYMIKCIETILENTDYHIQYDDEQDIVSFLKYMNVKMEETEGCLLERLVDYIKIMSRLLYRKVVVIVNLKSYLSEDELKSLIQCAEYEKVSLILIESHTGYKIEDLKRYVIDDDLCEIY